MQPSLHNLSRTASLKLAVLCPPVPGHLNPMRALARALRSRGHRPVVFTIEDAAESVRADGLDTVVFGKERFRNGYLRKFILEIGERPGVRGTMHWQAERAAASDAVCREVPEVIRGMGLDALLVDQIEPAGQAVAEHLGLPFITIGNGLALNREPGLPPIFTGWKPSRDPLKRRLHDAVSWLGDRSVDGTNTALRLWRRQWGLQELPVADLFYAQSPLLQIMQIPEALDFPRDRRPQQLHYVGPLREGGPTYAVPFPFERVERDGRPLVYASLGTLQIDRLDLYWAITEALSHLEVQVVVAHGGSLAPDQERSLPGSPIVQAFVPQEELLKRAALCVTHGGLNTVLDALAAAVPLVVMPIAFEQSAIGARVAYRGAGMTVRADRRAAARIQSAAATILNEPSFAAAARKVAADIRASGEIERAVDLIENAITKTKRLEEEAM